MYKKYFAAWNIYFAFLFFAWFLPWGIRISWVLQSIFFHFSIVHAYETCSLKAQTSFNHFEIYSQIIWDSFILMYILKGCIKDEMNFYNIVSLLWIHERIWNSCRASNAYLLTGTKISNSILWTVDRIPSESGLLSV